MQSHMRDYDRKVQFWRRRQRTFPAQHPMTALGLVAALWIAPVYAQEVVNCSSLKVTNNLVEKIDTSIQATGWPARMANVVTVSDEGIRLEIELRRSWVDSRSTKRPNTSVMGVPANLVSSESPQPFSSLPGESLVPGSWVGLREIGRSRTTTTLARLPERAERGVGRGHRRS